MELLRKPRATSSMPSTMPLQPARLERARAVIKSWPEYSFSPLRRESAVAAALGIDELWLKDETRRLGVGSFKALGGGYAVGELVAGVACSGAPTFATASAGNHGIGVAWASRRLGHECHVFLDDAVPECSAERIRAFGGIVHRSSGGYEASVEACRIASATQGWTIVQDVDAAGYTQIPLDIFAGYSVLASEIAEQLEACGARPPTHVLVNAGVGGLASSVCASFWARWKHERPLFFCVEPSAASCLLHSAREGRLSAVPRSERRTRMVGLDCKVPTSLAWDVLQTGADGFCAVGDEVIHPCQRLLEELEPSLPAGESAVAGLGALLAAAAQPQLRAELALDQHSRVALIICEGPTEGHT